MTEEVHKFEGILRDPVDFYKFDERGRILRDSNGRAVLGDARRQEVERYGWPGKDSATLIQRLGDDRILIELFGSPLYISPGDTYHGDWDKIGVGPEELNRIHQHNSIPFPNICFILGKVIKTVPDEPILWEPFSTDYVKIKREDDPEKWGRKFTEELNASLEDFIKRYGRPMYFF